MLKTASEKIAHSKTYQQALDDFGVTDLMSHIRNYADEDFKAAVMNLEEQELESLAAILIQRLISSLNGKAIANYLNAIRHGDSHVIVDPTHWQVPSLAMDWPDNFPDGVTPRYAEGDRIRWRTLTNTTDWGIAIGRFYAYARHRCQWAVGYLVKLDHNSPSAAWVAVDTAWEDDLEPNTDNDGEQLEPGENWLRDRPNGSPEEVGTQYSLKSDSPKKVARSNWETTSQALSPKSLSPLHTPDLRQSIAPTPTFTRHEAVLPTLRHRFPTVHAPSGKYHSDGTDATNPRILTQRERNLIELYSNCQLGLTPMRFYAKWSVRYQEIASICSRSISTVERWFNRGRNYRRPTFNDLRHLAVMDFLLEHFEEIPAQLLSLLCPRNHR
jgi:hypothetical protein